MHRHPHSLLFARVAVLGCALAWLPATFAGEADWLRCAGIASALERLDCYDAVARDAGHHADPVVPQEQPRDAAPRRDAPPGKLAPVHSFAAPPAPAPANFAASEEFGFDERLQDTTPDRITTRYDGAFTGWSGETLFRLANGQVWKQAQAGRLTFHRDRPRITIRRGTFGAYRLTVEGVDRSIRVTRIK